MLRARQSGYIRASESTTSLRKIGAKGCRQGESRWFVTWRGEKEIIAPYLSPAQGGYWLTVCADGWKPDRTLLNRSCAENPVLVQDRSLWVSKDWTVSHSGGSRVPVNIMTDRKSVDITLQSSTGDTIGEWLGADPQAFRLYAPYLAEGDSLRLRVKAGSVTVNVPVVVRSTLPLDRPLNGSALIVMPALTWISYNRPDTNSDGWQDSWYAMGTRRVGADVPIIAPMITTTPESSEADYEWLNPFFLWRKANAATAVGAIPIQVVTDIELESMSPTTLRRYRMLVFPGHTEYYTGTMYNRLLSYRARGGDMLFLQANTFYRRVIMNRKRNKMYAAWDMTIPCACSRSQDWNDYNISGVGYTGYEYDFVRPFVLASSAADLPGVMDGVTLPAGSAIGTYAIEFDSPPPVGHPSRDIFTPIWHDPENPDAVAGGMMRHLSGAETFASGTMLFPLAMMDTSTPVAEREAMQRILTNVYLRMAEN
jgi:hypothetical protein